MRFFNKKWQVFLLVGVSIFMSTLDSSIVNVALPYIMEDLSSDVKTVQWVVVVYLLTVSSLLLTFGRLSDIKGRQVIYVVGFFVFTLGSLLCGQAMSPRILVGARALQGVGAAMLMACSPALVVDAFSLAERGKALGMMGAVVAAGLTLGPLAGGMILEYFSWRLIFYINVPIGILAAAAGVFVLKGLSGGKGTREPLDMTGSLLLMVMLSCLIVPLVRSSDWGFISLGSGVCLMTAIICCIGFVYNEKQSAYPLLDLNLMKIRLFTLPLISSAILFASLFVLVFMMPFFLTFPCGFSASKTGIIMIVPFLFLLVISPISGILADRLGSRMLCTLGMVFMALSLFSLIFSTPVMGTGAIVWRMALAGIGTALFVSPNNTAIMGAVPVHQRGIASGATATARNLGMVSGVALAGAIFSFFLTFQGQGPEGYVPDMAPAFMAGFRHVMAAGSAMATIGALVTFFRGRENMKNFPGP
ncbi:MAG: MFS transporter [Desulfotignum sp.]|nr:MFS transporter [Desulfotignum sp.]MCF8113097.1 MFS transporter [Desulfotignum sp.]MCF8125608.1 MFS transporter [Desulfotignum sp.]